MGVIIRGWGVGCRPVVSPLACGASFFCGQSLGVLLPHEGVIVAPVESNRRRVTGARHAPAHPVEVLGHIGADESDGDARPACRVPDAGFMISEFSFGVSDFGFRVLDFRF